MNNQNHNYDKITEENSRWTQNLDRRPLENEDDAKPEISSLQEYESKGVKAINIKNSKYFQVEKR